MRRLAPSLLFVLVTGPLVAEQEPSPSHSTVDEKAQALNLLQAGKLADAAARFSEILANDPGDIDAVEGRIRSLLAFQDWKRALAEAREFHRRFPEEPRVRSALGQALFRAGEFEEVETALAPLLLLPDVPARALVTLGRLRDAQGRLAEAVALMDRAVERDPDDRFVLYWAAGNSATREQAVSRLRGYLERSAGDDPDRIEAARGSIRVSEALGERAIWVTAERPERVELKLRRIWDLPSGILQGFVIHAVLGGQRKPVPLLLDSGSPGLWVLHRVARKRGFEPMAERIAFGGGGDRRHRTTRGFFSSVEVGGLLFTDALATTTREELDPTGRFLGLIGLSQFNGYRITIDLERDVLLLEPPGELSQGEPYWTVAGQLLVRAEVLDHGSRMFLLDTGASATMVGLDLVGEIDGARLGQPTLIRGFGGPLQDSRRLSGVQVRFSGARSGDRMGAVDPSTRSRLAGVEIGGFLGLEMLDGMRIVVDSVARRIQVLEPTRRRGGR